MYRKIKDSKYTFLEMAKSEITGNSKFKFPKMTNLQKSTSVRKIDFLEKKFVGFCLYRQIKE
jgi:hypothetical protein